MPIYEYKCHRCGKKFDVLQRFSDDPLKTHEECGGEVERLISPPALHFKGGGWYITDYAKGGTSPSTSSSNGSDAKSESKQETKTETKSETKAATTPSKSDH